MSVADSLEFRDPTLVGNLVAEINCQLKLICAERNCASQPLRLMEVCGTHTVSIARYGLRTLLPPEIKLLSGPGCPVCVTANSDIDKIVSCASLPGVILTTFGDMLRVMGSQSSLQQAKAAGAQVEVVYSPLDALDCALAHPDAEVVFAGVGFETTTPLVAATILRAKAQGLANFSVISAQKQVPPALAALLADPEVAVNALILPGHVSTILGVAPYQFIAEEYGIPCVITGFEPADILQGIACLLRQIAEGRKEIEIAYSRGVKPEGNPTALAAIAEVFEPVDAHWRGLGAIAASGYQLREKYADFDACKRFDIADVISREPKGCRCGDVLRGVISPSDCPLFGKACTPLQPIGPCMVSSEGSCAAYYRYRI